jgi:hypothetical protein
MKHIFHLSLFLVSVLFSCSGKMDALIPQTLDEKGEAKLEKKLHDEQAAVLFRQDPIVQSAIIEFNPKGISAGVYNFGGIIINLGLARCESADDAYGIYSALTAMPRERWEYKRGEMSYRSPYFAGYNGEYVFWITSPTNPMTYASFYRTHGEKMLAEFDSVRVLPGCTYHWKILPVENRFADSMFYIRSRTIGGIDVVNAYGATYQAQASLARIYVTKMDSEQDAKLRYGNIVTQKLKKKNPTEFIPIPGTPLKACHWREKGGVWILCQYRWMMFLITDMPSVDYTVNFIRIMFNNMMKVRTEAIPKK